MTEHLLNQSWEPPGGVTKAFIASRDRVQGLSGPATWFPLVE
jgi:hypothetical protein